MKVLKRIVIRYGGLSQVGFSLWLCGGLCLVRAVARMLGGSGPWLGGGPWMVMEVARRLPGGGPFLKIFYKYCYIFTSGKLLWS